MHPVTEVTAPVLKVLCVIENLQDVQLPRTDSVDSQVVVDQRADRAGYMGRSRCNLWSQGGGQIRMPLDAGSDALTEVRVSLVIPEVKNRDFDFLIVGKTRHDACRGPLDLSQVPHLWRARVELLSSPFCDAWF
jgi:hypothetical protein